jgi:hypothetical protein
LVAQCADGLPKIISIPAAWSRLSSMPFFPQLMGMLVAVKLGTLHHPYNMITLQNPKASLDGFGFKTSHINFVLIKLKDCRPRIVESFFKRRRCVALLLRNIPSPIKLRLKRS